MKKLKWLWIVLMPIFIMVVIVGSVVYFLQHAKFSFTLQSGDVSYIKNEEVNGVLNNFNGDIHFSLKDHETNYKIDKRKEQKKIYVPAILDQTSIKNKKELSKEEILKLGIEDLNQIENKTYYVIDEVLFVYQTQGLTKENIQKGKYKNVISFKEQTDNGCQYIECVDHKNHSSNYFANINGHIINIDDLYNQQKDIASNKYRITRKNNMNFPSVLYKEDANTLIKIAEIPKEYNPYNIYEGSSYIYISALKNKEHCILKYDKNGILLHIYNSLQINIHNEKIENIYQNNQYMTILHENEVVVYDEKRNTVVTTYKREKVDQGMKYPVGMKYGNEILDMVFKNGKLYVLEAQFENDFDIHLYVYENEKMLCDGKWSIVDVKENMIDSVQILNYHFQIHR